MPKKIDWLYHRKSCITCQRAETYRGTCGTEVTETVNATKVRYSAADAIKLLDGIDKFIAMRGAKMVTFDLKKDRPTDDVLLAHLMGPTGNLRAPTARLGKLLVVGFNEATFKEQGILA
jgi:arsenate reductase-like glutaredoxin family protein